MSQPRVLVLRALGLGDLLTGVPALRAVRRALPGHELLLAAPEPLRPLVELVGTVDRLLPTRPLEPVPWWGPPPEVAVDLHGRGPQSHRVLQALGPGRLVAFGNAEAGVPGPRWDEDEHEVRRWLRLLQEALEATGDPGDLLLDRPPQPPVVSGAVVVHPGAASPARRWPADRFADVARGLAATGRPVVVTGSAAESDLAFQVQQAAGLPAEAVLAGRTDLAALAAVVAAASLVVCGDTGTAHLASAYRTPSVVLFGPMPPHRWGPPAQGPHVAVWKGHAVGDPHAGVVDPALLDIDVAEVLGHAEALMPRQPPGSRRRTTPASVADPPPASSSVPSRATHARG